MWEKPVCLAVMRKCVKLGIALAPTSLGNSSNHASWQTLGPQVFSHPYIGTFFSKWISCYLLLLFLELYPHYPPKMFLGTHQKMHNSPLRTCFCSSSLLMPFPTVSCLGLRWSSRPRVARWSIRKCKEHHVGMSENGVYPQWNSHLVGIMIINHWV